MTSSSWLRKLEILLSTVEEIVPSEFSRTISGGVDINGGGAGIDHCDRLPLPSLLS